MSLNIYEVSKLISKHIQGELSESERFLLEEWVNESVENQKLFDRLIQSEQIEKSFHYFDSLDVDSSWKRARKNRLIKKTKKLAPYLAYAATITGIVFSLFMFLPKETTQQPLTQDVPVLVDKDLLPGGDKAYLKLANGKVIHLDGDFKSVFPENGLVVYSDRGELRFTSKLKNTHNLLVYNTLSVPKTGTYRVVLADGTKVWLNSLSELEFPVQFSDTQRIVKLTGEAYFEVAEDKSKPFIVEVNDNTIEVLGTHFNVNSYDSNWKTTLFEGRVKIANNLGSKLLSPGQEANIIGDEIIIGKAGIKKATAWRNKEFYFEKETMHSILMELSRWYGFEINDHRPINNKRFTGSIDRDLKLSQVLKILNSLSGFQFHFDGENLNYN